MNIGIVGAGVAGLHLAYHLAKEDGHEVTLYEKADFIGGLAHYYPIDGTYLEKFYHFIMTADVEYLDFLEKLGVLDELHWINTHTSFFADGKMYDFSTPVDVLKFGAIPITARLRFAATMAYLTKVANNWRKLEKHLAHEWLRKYCGQRAWEVIWESNLRMKFGSHVEAMTMPWIWARSRMVNQYRDLEAGGGAMAKEKRAWIKGSTKTFLEAAEKGLADCGVTVRTGVDIEEITREGGDSGPVTGVKVKGEEATPHDRVVYCAPSYVLHDMLKGVDGDPYFEMIREQRYIGVVCAVLALDKNLTEDFWVYVNDKRVPFVGVINYSPFLDYEGHEGHHVIYIPAYCDPGEYPYTEDDDALIKKYCDGLKVMWPEFDESWIREKRVFRVPNASLCITGEYSKKLPDLKSPIENFFFANLSQIYPQDRGISISMKLSNYAREAVNKNENVEMVFSPY